MESPLAESKVSKSDACKLAIRTNSAMPSRGLLLAAHTYHHATKLTSLLSSQSSDPAHLPAFSTALPNIPLNIRTFC